MSTTEPDHEFSDERIPLGYLITFRSYGTWLHGEPGSVDRFHNIYGTPRLPGNQKRKQYNQRILKQRPVKLDARQRAVSAIGYQRNLRNSQMGIVGFQYPHQPCSYGRLRSVQTRTNTQRSKSQCNPQDERIGLLSERGPWVRRGSKRYLWTEEDLRNAIAYVLYEQGDSLP